MKLIQEIGKQKISIKEDYFNFPEKVEDEYIQIDYNKEITANTDMDDNYIKFPEESLGAKDTTTSEDDIELKLKMESNSREVTIPEFTKLWKANSCAFNDFALKNDRVFKPGSARAKLKIQFPNLKPSISDQPNNFTNELCCSEIGRAHV